MIQCEQRNKRKIFLTGQSIKVQCKKESKMIDENGRYLCKHHFNKWFKKKYKEDYETFINKYKKWKS